jgi:uncharacterized protein YkwD
MRILQTSVLFSVAALVLSCAGLPIPIPTGGSTGTGAGTGRSSSAVAAEVVAYTNEARARNGLPALRSNSRLMEAARIHAEQMAAYQRADHTISGAQYPTMQSRLQAVGYSYSSAAENVAWNQPNAQSVLNSWMSSSGHRANILDRGLTEMGAAMARSSKGEPYWIQVFGTPR